jgi:hypothetical protein
MKRMKINFALIALVLGVSAAFATEGNAAFSNMKYRFDGTQWININTQVLGTDYNCNQTHPSDLCTAKFTQDPNVNGTGTENTVESGDYVALH